MAHEHLEGANGALFSTALISDVAQDVSNYPWQALNRAEWLHDRGMIWYRQAGLTERDPGRADYLATRAVWNALSTPLVYGGEQTLLAEMLPRIQRGQRLASSTMISSDTFDGMFTQSYEGGDLALLRTMSAHSSTAMKRFMHKLTTNPSQWHFPVWQAFAEWHPRFCALESAHKRRPGNRPIRSEKDPRVAIMEVAIDSNETVWSIIKRALKHFPTWGKDWEQNPKGGLLSIMDELERAPSKKSVARKVYFVCSE